ncbi:MAG: hypothetical protein J6I76_18885 [Oribacterium sp.]|nr:hypothetical protein [Oribacterium sp.]
MEKYENMVIRNRQTSQEKVDKAIAVMHKMFSNDEQVVVCTLVKKTGLSRAFFYNNAVVHSELVRLQELQYGKSFVAPQKIVITKAMDREIELLKKKLAEKESIISQQKTEIQKLKKAAQVNLVSTLKEL